MRGLALGLLLLVVASPLAVAASVKESSETVTERTISLWAPAVAQPQTGGPLVGALVRLEVSMRTGSGGVYVETQPLTQLDMQGAARLATTIAGGLTGEDLSGWDFTFVMRASSPTVGGPSAGGLMAVAVVALIQDWNVADDTLMTGMINPDGSIGPVGGILEKAGAAARGGARLFLIPEGQGTQVVTTVHSDNGVVTQQQEVVQVAQEAWDRWGLEVREVADVNDAVEGLTGHRFEEPEAVGAIASQVYRGIMGPAAANGIDDATAALADAEERFDASGISTGNALGQSLAAALQTGTSRLARARDAYQNESYYSATSLVFQTNVEIRTVDETLDHLDTEANGRPDHFAARVVAIRADLDGVSAETKAFEPRTLSSLEALGASQQRILDATGLLDDAVDAWADNQVLDGLRSLAFAAERVRSVAWWLELAHELDDPDVSAAFDADTLPALAGEVLGSTLNTWTYADVLVQESGAGGTAAGQVIQQANANYVAAVAAQDDGLHAGALFESLEAQARINVGLTLFGGVATSTAAERFLDRAEASSEREIGRARRLGVEPVLAVSLHDFAATVGADGNTVEALVLYHTARMVAKSAEFTLRPATGSSFVGYPNTRPYAAPEVVISAGLAGLVFGIGIAAAVVIAWGGKGSKKTAAPSPATAAVAATAAPARNARAAMAPTRRARRPMLTRRPRRIA